MKNKKGLATIYLIFLLVFAFIFIIGFGLLVFGMNSINNEISTGDVMAGQVNFTNASQLTFGKATTGLNNVANWLGVGILFAMFIGMMINAYMNRENNPKVFFIVDFIILFVAFILSLYISNLYAEIVGIDELSSTFSTYLPAAATFMLKLPLITIIAGILMMILSYSGIPITREEIEFSNN
jgi:hypothetical protein